MKVLVTNATRNSGLAVIRSLAKKGYEVIGADDRALPFNIRSRYTKSQYLLKNCEDAAYINFLIDIIEKEKIDILMPVGGYEQASRYKEKLKDYTNVLIPDNDSFLAANDKKKTRKECQKLGIPSPRLLSEEEAFQKLEKNKKRSIPLKIVLKPRKDIGRAEGILYLRNPDSLKKALATYKEDFGEYILEEYIPGKGNMLTVNLLFDQQTNLVAFFTTKKIKQWPPSGGLTALSESTDSWNLVEMVLPFFKKWGWQGLAEVELKIDSRDDIPKLIEINPRFWGYIGFPIKCGVNFPHLICQLLTGEKEHVDYPPYPEGVKYVNPFLCLFVFGSEIRSGKLRPGLILKTFKELQGKKVGNYFETRDCVVNIAKVFAQLIYRKNESIA